MFRRNRNLNRVLLFKQLVPDFRRCKACSFKQFSVRVFLVMYDRQFAWSIGKYNSVLSNKTYRSLWSGHAQLSSWDEEVSGKLYISTRTPATDWWKRRCHSDKNKRHNIAVTHWNPNYANYIWIFHPLFSALRHCCLTGRTRNPFVSLEIRYSVTEWKTRVTSAVHAKLCCGRKLGNHIAKGKPIHFLDFSDEVPECFSVFVGAVVSDSKSNEFQETAGSSGINFLAI